MSDRFYMPLAGFPHARVALWLGPSGTLWVRYTGEPDDLIAAGVATADMLTPGTHGVPRRDADGHHFAVERRFGSRKGAPVLRVSFSRCKPRERALLLPGVRELIEAGAEREAQVREELRLRAWDTIARAKAMSGAMTAAPVQAKKVRPSYLRLVIDNTRPVEERVRP